MPQLTVEQALSLALQHHQAGRLQQAISVYRQILSAKPQRPEIWHNLGLALANTGSSQEAVASFRRSLELRPEYPATLSGLGTALVELGDYKEATSCFRQATALAPDDPDARNNLGNILKDQGMVDEAIGCFRDALRIDATRADIHSNLVFAVHFSPRYDSRMLCREARQWATKHADPLGGGPNRYGNDLSAQRRLRIGYISPDFDNHCQAFFTIPLLSNHNRDHYEVYCYSDVAQEDNRTDRIKQLADCWRPIVGMSDTAVAELILRDKVDILVDLTMHMARNRLPVFARKPAPVQATWLAYPGTTGMRQIDYRISDRCLDPEGQGDELYTEKSWRLPDTFWCFDPLTTQPSINALPASASGRVTFGCLSNPCKLNDHVLGAWAAVLAGCEGARMIVQAPEGICRRRIGRVFAREGIASDRVAFVAKAPRSEYLRLYNKIDVGLDTFPYNGHTTSLDSFWMGVPVVTLVGQTVVGRAGLCQLRNLGLPELATCSTEEYVRTAQELAGDLPRLATLRAGLRSQMKRSPLMDAGRFAGNMESAFRSMWHAYCNHHLTGNGS